MSLLTLARMSEDEARSYLEGIMWPNGPVCPHCGSTEATRLQGKKHRPGLLQCNACREQFTVTINTIMEDSHIPLNKWVLAFHLMCSSKKGISALQLKRELDLGSYQSAWHMAHRIREAMDEGPFAELFQGFVETDETYVGGKPRQGDGKEHGTGRGTSKTPVVVAVERGGEARAEVVPNVSRKTLKSFVHRNVDPMAVIVTDEFASYAGLDEDFTGHLTVNHTAGEYARKVRGFSINTNTAESYFSLLKRGHYGVYHQMSRKHLNRYCNEFSFRWNNRKTSDDARTVAAIKAAPGKRLMYKDLVK